MGKFGRKLAGTSKKAMGASSNHSHGSLSTRYTEPKESPMHEDEENEPMEEQEKEQPMEEGDDDPHLDLEEDQEMQAYNLIKNHEFIHTPSYDPDLPQKIGLDTEFATIWKAVGWEKVAPVYELGSCLLTIQFVCSLQEVEGGITFCLFEKEYYLTWRNLSSNLGFSTKCSIDLDHALKGFNRHEFWRVISSQNVFGKFQPQNMNNYHPILRFMHR
jgi:hypothetical protein